MQCLCGFRTFSSIDMQRHHHSCLTWQTSVEGQQEDEPRIPLRHVQPLMVEIDATQDQEVEPGADAAERRASIEEESTVLKIMTS